MNITPTTRQITDFSFTLSSQDLERYLADPQAWAADVKAQLNGHVTRSGNLVAGPAENGGGRTPKAAAGAPAHARRQSQRRAPKPSGRKPSSSRKTRTLKQPKTRTPLACPECAKPFLTAGRLANHRRDLHNASPAEVLSTAIAGNAG